MHIVIQAVRPSAHILSHCDQLLVVLQLDLLLLTDQCPQHLAGLFSMPGKPQHFFSRTEEFKMSLLKQGK